MVAIRLLRHAPGAPGLRWLGLGPGLRPSRGLLKLQRLFNHHAFWARERSYRQLRRLLAGSPVVVSLWRGKRLVGFGRASSDGECRAVLWDVVVAEVSKGVAAVSRSTGVPVIFGVLTTDTMQQALERAGIKSNLGWSYALQAIEMGSLMAALPA